MLYTHISLPSDWWSLSHVSAAGTFWWVSTCSLRRKSEERANRFGQRERTNLQLSPAGGFSSLLLSQSRPLLPKASLHTCPMLSRSSTFPGPTRFLSVFLQTNSPLFYRDQFTRKPGAEQLCSATNSLALVVLLQDTYRMANNKLKPETPDSTPGK
ncbi:hypothetical protein L209DRAFT_129036 [Thermothelomyces heterothallicus CBS 203.75]